MARMRFRDRRKTTTNDNGTSFQDIKKERETYLEYKKTLFRHKCVIAIISTLFLIQSYYLYKHF
jgi:hypothetical protein